MMDPLIAAAFRDQERRVLEMTPLELVGARRRRRKQTDLRPVDIGKRVYCADGCTRWEYRTQVSAGYICQDCRKARHETALATEMERRARRKAARIEKQVASDDGRLRCPVCSRRLRQNRSKTFWYCTKDGRA